MALNSIIPINTKIQEVEQCDPVSSPSSTIDENKSFLIYLLIKINFKFYSVKIIIILINIENL